LEKRKGRQKNNPLKIFKNIFASPTKGGFLMAKGGVKNVKKS